MIMLPRSTSPWTEIEDRVETLPWEKRNFPLSEEELSEMEVGLVFFLLFIKNKSGLNLIFMEAYFSLKYGKLLFCMHSYIQD